MFDCESSLEAGLDSVKVAFSCGLAMNLQSLAPE
jgi:hypothetical protein